MRRTCTLALSSLANTSSVMFLASVWAFSPSHGAPVWKRCLWLSVKAASGGERGREDVPWRRPLHLRRQIQASCCPSGL